MGTPGRAGNLSNAAMIRQAVADDGMRRRAAEIGQPIEAENGVSKAVEVIERYLVECPPGRK